MTVPETSGEGGEAIEMVGGAGGDSRKLPAWRWALTSRSTRRRSASSGPQAPARKAARSSAVAISIAAQKIESKSQASGVMGESSERWLTAQCEFQDEKGSPRRVFFSRPVVSPSERAA